MKKLVFHGKSEDKPAPAKIAYAEGTTTANAMSTFMMVTADGTEMGFMKDGCPMDEDALGGDSGAKIGVVYMDSEDVSFPLEIRKLQ